MDLKLRGKRALITGSTQGIGFAIAEGLVREGADVVVNGRTNAKVEGAIEKIAASTKARSAALPRCRQDGRGQAARRAQARRYPGQQYGIFEPKPFHEIADGEWLRYFEVNVMSGVRSARTAAAYAEEMGTHRLHLERIRGPDPPEMIHYGITKTAQLAISRGIAETTPGTGMTVNAVLPGPTRSEGVVDFWKSSRATAR